MELLLLAVIALISLCTISYMIGFIVGFGVSLIYSKRSPLFLIGVFPFSLVFKFLGRNRAQWEEELEQIQRTQNMEVSPPSFSPQNSEGRVRVSKGEALSCHIRLHASRLVSNSSHFPLSPFKHL